jgi:hypothetical protein
MAEAFAILWAVELARTKMLKKVIFEGDTKICFDALNDTHESINWAIVGIISNISLSSSSFHFLFL